MKMPIKQCIQKERFNLLEAPPEGNFHLSIRIFFLYRYNSNSIIVISLDPTIICTVLGHILILDSDLLVCCIVWCAMRVRVGLMQYGEGYQKVVCFCGGK